MNAENEVIHSRIWNEVADTDNPFVAKECYCSGYDVYGEIVGNSSWIEYLFLLFKRERPSKDQIFLLEHLAIAIANPGLRDHSIRAAMNAGVGGSTSASCLIAALAVGAGQLGGAREVKICMEAWISCGKDLDAWHNYISEPTAQGDSVWGKLEHPPGFYPHATDSIKPVTQTLAVLTRDSSNGVINWLTHHRSDLERFANSPLAFSGLAAAVFTDLGFSPSQGEMLYLLLRLPGAAVHALEQEQYGWREFPFFHDGLELTDDPGPIN